MYNIWRSSGVLPSGEVEVYMQEYAHGGCEGFWNLSERTTLVDSEEDPDNYHG